MHMIIQDIYRTKTSTVKFLCKSRRGWSSNELLKLRAISLDLMHKLKNRRKTKVWSSSLSSSEAKHKGERSI